MGLGPDSAGVTKADASGLDAKILEMLEQEGGLGELGVEGLDGNIDFANLLGEIDQSLTNKTGDNALTMKNGDQLLTVNENQKANAEISNLLENRKSLVSGQAGDNISGKSDLQQLLQSIGRNNSSQQISGQVPSDATQELLTEEGVKIHKFNAKSLDGKNSEITGLKSNKIQSEQTGIDNSGDESQVLTFNRDMVSKNSGLNSYKKNSEQQEKSLIRSNISMELNNQSGDGQTQKASVPLSVLASSQNSESTDGKKVGSIATKLNNNVTSLNSNAPSTQVIRQINDYLMQVAASNKNSAELTIKHQELGDINIKINKVDHAGDVAINIHTLRPETQGLIREGEAGLIKNLGDIGIKVSEFKLSSSSSISMMSDSKTDNLFNKDSQSRSSNSFEQFASGNNSQRGDSAQQDSQRRRAIWDMYRERMGA
jgi:predicted RNA-binding protein Jag